MIHYKKALAQIDGFILTACNQVVREDETTDRLSFVTCTDCLLHRPAKTLRIDTRDARDAMVDAAGY